MGVARAATLFSHAQPGQTLNHTPRAPATPQEEERHEASVQQMLLTPAATLFTLAGDYAGAGGWVAGSLAPGELMPHTRAQLRSDGRTATLEVEVVDPGRHRDDGLQVWVGARRPVRVELGADRLTVRRAADRAVRPYHALTAYGC